MTSAPSRGSLLVFSDDWGRHPSSCQHLIGQLLSRYDVLWVNTIGMRPPRLDRLTLRRGWEKLRQWAAPSAGSTPLPPRLRVLNPRMWPWAGSRLGRRLNQKLLCRQLLPALAELPRPTVAVTTIPIVADLMGRLPVSRWVYYCVDDFGVWPGLDQKAMRDLEGEVIARADCIVAVSETLQQRIAALGRSASLLTHGVDLAFWKGNGDAGPLPEIAGLEKPHVLFWGVIDRRMDVDFIARLASRMERGTILLAGPVNNPEAALWKLPHVVRLGSVPFEHLPGLAREAAVLVMPYADLPVTRAIQPLKLKEYLATGKPTVVRRLPATECWGDCLDLADNADIFADLVMQRLREGLPLAQERARHRLAQEGWPEKAERFEAIALASGDDRRLLP